MLKSAFCAGLAAGLAACAPADTEDQADYVTDAERIAPSPPSTGDTAREPNVEQAADTKSSDALTPDGWKDLRIGMTREKITALYGPDAQPDAVDGPDPESCAEYRPENAPDGMLLMLVDGKLARISLIREAAVKTEKALGLGATAEDVKTAYGGKAIVTPHKYVDPPAEYITIWREDRSGISYVEDPEARGLRYVVGEDGKVQTIHAGGPAIQLVEGCL